ncbi:unnamed protein product [Kuraishia capsulata CBS 1993]|uniref:Aldehyde dehydrogenase domain-containing protein n=1 Tax=Kuraishia capsulata CBS 1993 TaxID=1382522 RepID=W6MIH0_9ASCO|nr:uncharacterized protein KUCA_T00002235001 [Kuraishia capsulata CBS 1993]CDK26264.1 unnamed protein product [Kuraishia capsulata CBS 1993]
MTVGTTVVPLLINGEQITSSGNPNLEFTVSNPFKPDQVLYSARGATPEEANVAVETTQKGFFEWKEVSYTEKREIFNRAAILLSEKKSFFVQILKEMAISEWFANVNVEASIDMLKEAASLTSVSPGTLAQSSSPDLSIVVNEPIGPVLSIVPWNSPMVLCVRALVWPLAAGCSVLLKTSELSPLVHYELAKVMQDAGVPAAAMNSINISSQDAPSIIKQMIEHKGIRKVNFTGSTGVGRVIAQIASGVLKPVLLELGGKCASIVTESADLKKAAFGVVTAAFANNGQICMSTERVFVVQSVYDEFIKEVAAAADVVTKEVHLPQRTRRFAEAIEGILSSASEDKAEVIYGSIHREDAFVKPVILGNVHEKHTLYDVETFGPTCYINSVSTVEDAVNKVNSSNYGLSCGLWCSDIMKAVELARLLDTGAVHINGMTIHDEPVLPHGGVKSSGFGRFNGVWGIREFQYPKTITISPK